MNTVSVLLFSCVFFSWCLNLHSWYTKIRFEKDDSVQHSKLIQHCFNTRRPPTTKSSIARYSIPKGKDHHQRLIVKPKPPLYLALALLVGSWDIELNPGPNVSESIYPCGTCSEPVTWEQNAISCDSCDVWFHKECIEMSTTLFNYLSNADVSWICPLQACNQPNYSGILFNSPLVDSSNNPFPALADSMREINSQVSLDPLLQLSPLASINTASTSRTDSLTDQPVGPPQATSSPTLHTNSRKRTVLKDNFKIAIMNCQSVNNKISELHTFVSATDPDVLLGTESWLKPDTLSCEIFPEGYNVYRKDRDMVQKSNGGGVFILIRKEYASCEININTTCELLFVELKLADQKNVKIGCLYRPPWTDDKYVEDLEKVLQEIDPQRDCNIWLGGDFNLPHIDWTDEKTLPCSTQAKLSDMLLNVSKDFCLSQVVKEPTRKENILDLFLTSDPSLINRVTTTPPLSSEADHNIVFIDVNTRAMIPKRTLSHRFIYNKADWDSIKDVLSQYTLPMKTVQEQWNDLESTLLNLMKKHIPTKLPRPQKHQPWISRDVITFIHKRNRAFKKWKKTNTKEQYDKYLKLRSECQKKIRSSHRQYTEKIFNLDDPQEPEKVQVSKRFWTYVKSRKKDTCSVSPLKSEGVLISDAKGKANILNQQYCSVFSIEDTSTIPSKGHSTKPTLPDTTVTEEGVLNMLQQLDPHKAAGPDKISP